MRIPQPFEPLPFQAHRLQPRKIFSGKKSFHAFRLVLDDRIVWFILGRRSLFGTFIVHSLP